ncbi:hypothetical protein SP41_108 [Salmonella phage 41]|nr:hypothetical protein SP41_108 [Salmonella phage 41]
MQEVRLTPIFDHLDHGQGRYGLGVNYGGELTDLPPVCFGQALGSNVSRVTDLHIEATLRPLLLAATQGIPVNDDCMNAGRQFTRPGG